MTWGIYARVSSKGQAREGLSIEAQLSALRSHFKAKGLAVIEYVDAGRSAWTEDLAKRPAFKQMLDDAFAGQLEGLGVTHIDRFSRRAAIAIGLIQEFQKRGIGFVSLENSTSDNNRPSDQMRTNMESVWAQYYSDELSLKIKRGLLTRASKGLHIGLLSFGFCNGKCPGCPGSCAHRGKSEYTDGTPKLHPEDAPGVLLAFRTAALGTHSDAMVARVLNEAGYRSRTRKGRVRFNKESISHLLTNPFYTGRVVIKGQEFQGQQSALIPRSLFDEVQRIRRRHFHRSKEYHPRHRVYLFAGILICAGCGRRMRAASYGRGDQGRGYRCTAVESGRKECDRPQGVVKADLLEAQFGEIVHRLRLPADWRERISELVARNGERRNLESERKQARQKLERIKWLYAEGDLSQKDYLREKGALESKLAALVRPPEREVLDAGAYLENLAAVWDAAMPGERKEIVLALVDQLVCDPRTKRLVSFKPRSAFLPLFRQLPGLSAREGAFEVAG